MLKYMHDAYENYVTFLNDAYLYNNVKCLPQYQTNKYKQETSKHAYYFFYFINLNLLYKMK